MAKICGACKKEGGICSEHRDPSTGRKFKRSKCVTIGCRLYGQAIGDELTTIENYHDLFKQLFLSACPRSGISV